MIKNCHKPSTSHKPPPLSSSFFFFPFFLLGYDCVGLSLRHFKCYPFPKYLPFWIKDAKFKVFLDAKLWVVTYNGCNLVWSYLDVNSIFFFIIVWFCSSLHLPMSWFCSSFYNNFLLLLSWCKLKTSEWYA